jgi:hypothetical protein
MLGGIGFTMSIFIANLAFAGDAENVNASKLAILLGSLTAGIIGFLWLKFLCNRSEERIAGGERLVGLEQRVRSLEKRMDLDCGLQPTARGWILGRAQQPGVVSYRTSLP